MDTNKVGWLNRKLQFICCDCAEDYDWHVLTPVVRDNIGDYRQNCADCQRVIVQPKTSFWRELFAANEHTREVSHA